MNYDFHALTDGFGAKIIGALRADVAARWDKWTPEERDLAERCAKDAAGLAIRALAGEDVSAERKQVDAQLAGIKVAGLASASAALWEAVGTALRVVISAALKA